MWYVSRHHHNARLPLKVLTIVKDGMPWIAHHYCELRKLKLDWQWLVVEGTAAAENCTAWCASNPPGLSTDGTTQYLDALAAADKRIVLYRSELWHGKIAMVNEPLKHIWNPCVLLEADSDELWTADQLSTLVQLFSEHPERNAAYFVCRYFIGLDVVISTRGGFGNHLAYEWFRAFRAEPGFQFVTHEPIEVNRKLAPFTHAETEAAGLVFDHMAYATAAQVEAKVQYYGSGANQLGHLYTNALDGWRRLQANRKWPAQVRDFLPFVRDDSQAIRLTKE